MQGCAALQLFGNLIMHSTLCVLLNRRVVADIRLMVNGSIGPIADLPAAFGPKPPPNGLTGILRVADPEDACQPLVNAKKNITWVALVSRQQHSNSELCTFDTKVRNAQKAGAAAVIVYNNNSSLVLMVKDQSSDDPIIPSTCVALENGLFMQSIANSSNSTMVNLIPAPAGSEGFSSTLAKWRGTIIVLVFCLFLPALLVVALFVRFFEVCCRYCRSRFCPLRPSAPTAALPTRQTGPPRLPVVVRYEPPPTASVTVKLEVHCDALGAVSLPIAQTEKASDNCIICLQHCQSGERLTVTPCLHTFHTKCLDKWLEIGPRGLCPLCKTRLR